MKKPKLRKLYEIRGTEGYPIGDDKWLSKRKAIRFAKRNGGYAIDRIYLPIDENGNTDYDADIVCANEVWKNKRLAGGRK